MIRTELSPYTGCRRHSDNSSLMDSTLFNIPFSCIRRPLVYISLMMRTSYCAPITEDAEKCFNSPYLAQATTKTGEIWVKKREIKIRKNVLLTMLRVKKKV